MTIHVWRRAFLFSLVAAIAGPAAALAQERPFKISGAGEGTQGLPRPGEPPRPHWAVGQATYLGRYHGEGTIATDSAVPDLASGIITGEFGSGAPFVFAAANGDELVVEYGRTAFGAAEPGTFTLTILGALPDGRLLVEAHFVAEFVVQPDLSTGRFEGVTGSWIMDAYTEPFVLSAADPVAYWWEGQGTLTFPHGAD